MSDQPHGQGKRFRLEETTIEDLHAAIRGETTCSDGSTVPKASPDQPGVWTVDLRVDFDGITSAGQVRAPFPTGDVLGTSNGRFHVYVVERGSAPLAVELVRDRFLSPAVSTLAYTYDPVALSRNYPNLDVSFNRQPTAVDVITISLCAFGTTPSGRPTAAARVVALHGAEQLNLPLPGSLAPYVSVTTDRTSYRLGDTLELSVHVGPGTAVNPVDVYVGLRRPDGSFLSLARQGGGFTLGPPAVTPAPVLSGTALNLNYSNKVAARAWTAGDPTGEYTGYVVLVRAGESPLDPATWVAIDAVRVTLVP